MIQSKYIFDILDKLVEGLPKETDLLKLQLPHLIESGFEYTGVGLFVSFSYSEPILQYRTKEDEMIIDGVLIQSSELDNGALATVWVRKGLIDSLEIWSCSGDYPKNDSKDYKLIQTWVDTEFAPNIINNIKPSLLDRFLAFFKTKRKP